MEIRLQKNKKMLVLAIMSSMPKIIWRRRRTCLWKWWISSRFI